MNIISYLFSRSCRKHRWASRHLIEYRVQPRWLFIRRVRRIMNKPLIMERLIVPSCMGGGTITIPEFREITAIELADDIPLN